MKKKVLIEGMKCENCAKHVKEALEDVDGVISAEVNLPGKYLIIETNKEINDEAIKKALNSEKYEVVGKEA